MPLKIEFVQEPWPHFTEAQVAFLERMYAPRCLRPHETVEDHLRYAGKVDLIAQMREHVIGDPNGFLLNEDEEAALDDMAALIAQQE